MREVIARIQKSGGVLQRLWLEPIGIHVAMPPDLHQPARVTAFIDALRRGIKHMRGFRSAD